MCCHNQKGIEFKTIQTSIYEIFSTNNAEIEKRLQILGVLLSRKSQEEIYNYLKQELDHDSEVLLLLNHIDQSIASKLSLLCLKESEIFEKTQQITGESYHEADPIV